MSQRRVVIARAPEQLQDRKRPRAEAAWHRNAQPRRAAMPRAIPVPVLPQIPLFTHMAQAPAPEPKAQAPVVCCWLRNDLRLHDNPVLAKAMDLVAQRQFRAVLPVYFLDPRGLGVTAWGSPKTGAFRAQFLVESVLDLKRNLRGVRSDLLVVSGRPEEVLPRLLPPKSVVVTQEEVTSEERAVDRAVEAALRGRTGLVREWGATLYHVADVPFRRDLADLPEVFTAFKNKVEDRCTPRALLATPPPGMLPLAPVPPGPWSLDYLPTFDDLPWQTDVGHPTADPRAVLAFEGGETAALRRLKYYLWDSNCVARYLETRHGTRRGFLGGDYTTKFSPWMALGCLSARKIYHEIAAYERARTANRSTYWVVYELLWRDFYRFYGCKHGNRIFFAGGIIGQAQSWNPDGEAWRRWREGQTGMPLVDANMRELKATGWMSGKGRQCVASYLTLDLRVDWRRGADHFESVLLDYDVCSNWANWVSAAGLTGGRVNRFHIPKQSRDCDPEGEYIRTWVPELAQVPANRIHEPWLLSQEEQRRFGVRIGTDYPMPLQVQRAARPNAAPGRVLLGAASVVDGGRNGRSGYRSGGGGSAQGQPVAGPTHTKPRAAQSRTAPRRVRPGAASVGGGSVRSGGKGWGRPL